ncbi:transporter [bacterium]|nr:transporter [bacterium]
MIENHVYYFPYDQYWWNEKWVDFPQDSGYTSGKILSEIYWGAAREVTLKLTLPLIYAKLGDEENKGIGDAIFSILYQPLRTEDEESVGVVLWAGARLPTGDYDHFPPLGDGSYDVVFSIYSMSDFYGAINYSTVGLWLNTDDYEGNSIGEQYFYNFALQIPILRNKKPFANIMGELDGYFIDGVDFKKENFHQACLGIQYVNTKNLVIEAAVSATIYKVIGYRNIYTPVFGILFSF